MKAINKQAADTASGTKRERPEVGSNSAANKPPLTIAAFTTTS